jgi:transcription initiation factor TFIIH subunit 4
MRQQAPIYVMSAIVKNPLLPVTVQDQIRLWEMEQNRVQEAEGKLFTYKSPTDHSHVLQGYLYTEFGSQADYELVLKYAKECNLVLYESARDRQFFAKADGHALIRQYIERRGG